MWDQNKDHLEQEIQRLQEQIERKKKEKEEIREHNIRLEHQVEQLDITVIFFVFFFFLVFLFFFRSLLARLTACLVVFAKKKKGHSLNTIFLLKENEVVFLQRIAFFLSFFYGFVQQKFRIYILLR